MKKKRRVRADGMGVCDKVSLVGFALDLPEVMHVAPPDVR